MYTLAGDIHRLLYAIHRPFLRVEVSNLGPGQESAALDRLRAGGVARIGPEYPNFSTFSYIAHFVEVRMDLRTRRVRMSRVVSVADYGRVVSPRTAASQMRGGVTVGLSAALREPTDVNLRFGG